MAIANNFITERNNSEVIAVGLNAIREISSRCPLSMSEDLLGDLVLYRTYKDKGVSTAAKSLIQLFRDRNPLMLQKKMRGKPTEASIAEATKVRQYGEIDAKSYVPGAEIVALAEENKKRKRTEEDDDDDDSDEEKGEWEETDEESGEDEEVAKKDKKNRAKKRKHSEDDEEDDDDDSGDEWVDVSSESDDEKQVKEDGADEIQTNQLTLEEKEEKAAKISTEKILTQEDFKKIRIEQLKKKITDKNFVKNNKKKTISIETDSEEEEKMAKRFVA